MAKKIKLAIHNHVPPWFRGLRAEKIAVTPATLRNLGAWLSTLNEAAAFLNRTPSGLSDLMRNHPELRRAWDEGHEFGKSIQRRRQLQVAYSDTPQGCNDAHPPRQNHPRLARPHRAHRGQQRTDPLHAHPWTIVDPKLPDGEQEIDVARYGDDVKTRH